MTPALRKRHQRTWWFLGFALLLIWGASMTTIYKNKAIDQQRSNIGLEKINISIEKGGLPNTQMVSVQINQPLTSPQTLIYLTDNERNSVEKAQLLGRIDGVGTFNFPLDTAYTTMPKKIIKGYDAIHQKELFSLKVND